MRNSIQWLQHVIRTSSCVLCLKAGSNDDGAIRPGSVLLSSAPRNWSSCPLAPQVDLASSFLVFLLAFSLPPSPLVQSSEDSHVLKHVLSSLLGIAWWRGTENVVIANVVLAPDLFWQQTKNAVQRRDLQQRQVAGLSGSTLLNVRPTASTQLVTTAVNSGTICRKTSPLLPYCLFSATFLQWSHICFNFPFSSTKLFPWLFRQVFTVV